MKKLLTVFCVHSVLEYQQQQLDLSEPRSWAAPDKVQRYGASGQAAWTVLHVKITPCWVILLQPARRAAVLGQPSSLRPLGRLSRSFIHSEMSHILFNDFTRRFPNSLIKSPRFKYTFKKSTELFFMVSLRVRGVLPSRLPMNERFKSSYCQGMLKSSDKTNLDLFKYAEFVPWTSYIRLREFHSSYSQTLNESKTSPTCSNILGSF